MKINLVCCFVLGFVACSDVRAATLIESMAGLTTTPSATESLGYRFTANMAQQVVGLGYYDVDGNGLAASHDVGLWNQDGVLLAQATVTPSSPASGGYLYAVLAAPVVLVPGSHYYLAGTTVGDSWVYDVLSFTTNPAFSFVESYFAPNSPANLTFPSQPAGFDSREYFNVNLRSNLIPEPASRLLFGISLAALGFVHRRWRIRSCCRGGE
jgi:hypothetical protein